MQLELISFKTCPFVQRCVITLLEKQLDFTITYIEKSNKPTWFLNLSPLGKVPTLRVDDQVLFESAVINEYLDEMYLPSMHPEDPLLRALNRAWIEFGSTLIMSMVGLSQSKTAEEFKDRQQECKQKFSQLERQLTSAPFFNGEKFCLIDAAYAPVFMRLQLIDDFYSLQLLEDTPKIKEWSKKLLEQTSVKRSVVPEFPELIIKNIENNQGYLTTLSKRT